MKKHISRIITAIFILTLCVSSITSNQQIYAATNSSIVFDFNVNDGGITPADTQRMQLSVENGNLKCVAKYESHNGYMYIPLNNIDGEYYNRLRIISKVESTGDLNGIQTYGFSLYYQGIGKSDNELYSDSEARHKFQAYTNLNDGANGKYNTEYQEYAIDLSAISSWSDCSISKLRIDPFKNSSGTLYIDKIEFYHEDSVNQKNFNGDVCFFDNRFCHTASTPEYKRVDLVPKSNEITATRLMDYKSPDRTNYMYLKRNNNDDDCFFNVNLTMPGFIHANDFRHRYLKMEGDFRADILQEIDFLVRDTQTTGSSLDTHIGIGANGTLYAGGKSFPNAVKQGETFHLLWAMNLDTRIYDVYINGVKLLSNTLNANMKQFNMVRVNLTHSTVIGDLYVDNFNVTGLANPIVDGVETKTSILTDDDALTRFMSDKIGMHAYGNTLCKNGVKTSLETKGIYNSKEGQYYVTSDVLNKAFDLNLKDEAGEITGDITIKRDGNVTMRDGRTFKLNCTPIVKDGRMYVPVKQFAADAVKKHVWWFKTGIFLFTDEKLTINSSDWKWQSERGVGSSDGCTTWNDIDYLNAYLQYIRPDASQLKNDYVAATGDTTFTQHPRLFHTASEFAYMKQKYEANSDPVFTNKVTKYIAEADKYLSEPLADYTMWLDTMRHKLGQQLGYRFMSWGFAYHMTGDRKYVDAAFEQFEMAAATPDFNTSHIIDAGEAAANLAIGYDWFYNAFTPEQRQLALEVTREKSLDILASGLYGRLTSSSGGTLEWRAFRMMTNYNTIVNGGITLAAIATLEKDTDTAFEYIADSMRSIEYTMQMFPPGGAWTEGPEYLNYTLRYLIPWAMNMEKNFGQSYNVMDGQGMESIVDFLVACSGVDGVNNVGDGEKKTNKSYESYFYLANRYNKPYASYIRWQDLNSGNEEPTFYDLMYWDFGAQNIDVASLQQTSKMNYIEGMELFSIRDTYEVQNAKTYLSAHFGTTSGNHQHWDCGTFVLDLLGTRWAYDLGIDNYNLQNEQGYKGYEIFRKRGEAHNMLIINPTEYSQGVETIEGMFAPVIDAQSNESGGFVYADMSRIYEDASQMTLGYYVDDNLNSVTMRNEFTLKEAADCMWTMNTKGNITIDGNTAYVTRNGKAIKLEVICSGSNVRWQNNGNPAPLKETIPPEKFVKQNQNVGYKQLRLLFDAPAGENKLVIRISSKYGNIGDIKDVSFSDWKLPEGQSVTITETSSTVLANANLDNSVLVLAGYSEDDKLLSVDYAKNNGHATASISGTFYKTKAFLLDSFKKLMPVSASNNYTQTYSEKSQTAPIVVNFTEDMGGITSENPNKLQISLDGGTLKCVSDYSSGEASHLYLPLDDIDGGYYNRLKIRARADSIYGASQYNMCLYYTGVDKTDEKVYGESSDRGKYVRYTNLTAKDGFYSNSSYQEYIVDLSSIPKWSDCFVYRLRIDALKNAKGTLYIDKIELYHEDTTSH